MRQGIRSRRLRLASQQHLKASERVGSDTKVGRTRRSDCIAIALPIGVSGTEITGKDFFETTRTHLLNRRGAAIVLKSQLAPFQQVMIRNLGSGKEGPAQVIGPMGGQSEGNVYAIALLDPAQNLWNMNFPAVSEAEKTALLVPLECKACKKSDRVELDSLEIGVFEANGNITRLCERCGEPTVWQLAGEDRAAGSASPAKTPQSAKESTVNQTSSGRAERRHARAHIRVTACVVQPGFGSEEVVTVEDISRSGLSFSAAKVYHQGSTIEVAAPYTVGTANVFLPARVVRVENRPGRKLPIYAVTYLKKQP